MTLTVGMSMIPFDRYPGPDEVIATAQLAEKLDFDMISIGEHIITPNSYVEALGTRFYDSLVLGATIAASSTRLRVLYSAIVVPYHPPIGLAKALASLDVLSRGRLIVGVGSGWLKEEFDALGLEFSERGARLDEYLRVIKELWVSDAPRFDGQWVKFQDIAFDPRPLQKPHPPIWVGGWGKNVFRRAVELGDGYYPASQVSGGVGDEDPLDTLIRNRRTLIDLLEEAGRDPATFTFGHAIDYGSSMKPLTSHAATSPVERRTISFGYEPGPIIDHIAKAKANGTSHIVIRFADAPTHRDLSEAMERFNAEVMSQL